MEESYRDEGTIPYLNSRQLDGDKEKTGRYVKAGDAGPIYS